MIPFPFVQRPVVVIDATDFPDTLDDLDFVKPLPFYPGVRTPGPLAPGIYRQEKPKSLWVLKESCGKDAQPILREVVAHRLLNWWADPAKNGMLRVPAAVYNSSTMKVHPDNKEWPDGARAYKVTPYYDPNLGYIHPQGQNDVTRAMMSFIILFAILDYTDIHDHQFVLDPRMTGNSFLRPLRMIDPGGALDYAPHGYPKRTGKTIVPGSWGAPMEDFDILPALYVGLYNPFAKRLLQRIHGTDLIEQAKDALNFFRREESHLPKIFALLGKDGSRHVAIFKDRLAVLDRMIARYGNQPDVLKTEILSPRPDLEIVSLERRFSDAPVLGFA